MSHNVFLNVFKDFRFLLTAILPYQVSTYSDCVTWHDDKVLLLSELCCQISAFSEVVNIDTGNSF